MNPIELQPTPFQLAQIAAKLDRNGTNEPAKLAARALAIFVACAKTACDVETASRKSPVETPPPPPASPEKPIEPAPVKLAFPMKKARFIHLVLPQYRGKTAEQGKVWRAFVAAHPPGASNAHFDGRWHDLGQCAANLHQTPIPTEEAFYTLAKAFSAWFAAWREEETSRQRSEAGKKGRKKLWSQPRRVKANAKKLRPLLT